MVNPTGKDPAFDMVSIKNSLIAATLVVVMSASTAHAYVDPGTGSYLLQILIAGFLGAAFALKLYWARIKNRFSGSRSRRKRQKDESPGSDNERD
jgi:hypothetical protein